MDDWVTIKVRQETRERLKALGRKGETYDDVIRRLIEMAERGERK